MLGKLGELEVRLDLVDDCADQTEGTAIFSIICWDNVVYTLLSQQFFCNIDLLLYVRVIDSYGISTEHLDNLHTWNISLSITKIYHMRERNALVFLHLALIDLLIIPDAEDAFIDLEKELSLSCIIDSNSRPLGLSFLSLYKGTCEYSFEL